MKHEFTKIKGQGETRYVLETSVGATSTAGGATLSKPLGGVRQRDNILAQEADKTAVPAEKPRNFVAKNAKMGGAGQHRDKKKEQKQGKEKHKKPFAEQGVAEGLNEFAPDGFNSGGDGSGKSGKGPKARAKAQMIKAYGPGIITFRKTSNGGYFIQHEDDFGDTNSHQYDPQTGKVDFSGVTRSSYYGEGLPEGSMKRIVGYRVVGTDIFIPVKDFEQDGRYYELRGYEFEPVWDDEQGVAEGYQEYDDLRDKVEQILIKVYDKYGTRDQIIDVAKPMAQKVAQQMGLERYFDEIWSNALASHDVDTDFGDDDDDFDYTDYSMRKGERGMEEDDGASKEKETEFHSKLDKLVHNTFGKRKGETEGHDNPDHEISMASNELASIVEDAMRLLKLVKRYSEMEGLEAWQQSKITKAADYLNAVLNSLQGDAVFSKEDHSNFGNGWGQGSYDTYAGGRHGRGVAEVAGPEKCWPGHRKVGTKPGTGKNAGKRVNDCEKIGEQGVAEGSSDYVGNAIEDLRVSMPGLDRESFLDELYSYIDAEYGKQAADAAFAREDDAMFDEWYASYTDMAEAAPKGWEKTVKAMKKHDEIDNPWALAHWMKGKGYKSHKEDAYMAELAAKIAEKLDPNADVDVWVQDFQNADPNRYHQFRNKTPEKKEQMATAARYAAKNPSKK